MITKIVNGRVLRDDFNGFDEKSVYATDGVISAITDDELLFDEKIDAEGGLVIPGYVDIHNHGSLGSQYSYICDFADMLDFNCKSGITTVFPTVSTRPLEDTLAAIENIKRQMGMHKGANIGGIHLEGPFLIQSGAMKFPAVPPTDENFALLADALCGIRSAITIAPEVENALPAIKEGARRGIRMSLGHTKATLEEAKKAVECGAVGITHVFNVMPQYHHRDPGLLGVALTDERLTCEAICDFIHLAPETVKLVYKLKGRDGMIMISDSVFSGIGDGEYIEDGCVITIKNGLCTMPNGTITGSSFTLADGARNLVSIGIPICDVVKMASYNGAYAMGCADIYGSISVGKAADMLVVNEALDVKKVIKSGKLY